MSAERENELFVALITDLVSPLAEAYCYDDQHPMYMVISVVVTKARCIKISKLVEMYTVSYYLDEVLS